LRIGTTTAPLTPVSCAVGLDIAGRNGLVTLCGEAGHSLADRHPGDDFQDLRGHADMRLEDEKPVLD